MAPAGRGGQYHRCSEACLFYGWREDELQEPTFHKASYAPHQVLFNRDDPCHSRVFVICTGLIGCYWGESRPGKGCLEVLGSQDWVGGECWRDEVWVCEARALTEASGWWVKQAQWFELMLQRGNHQRCLQRQTERLRRLHQWQVVLAHGSVRARMAWQLLQLAERFGEAKPEGLSVPLYLTEAQEADLAGATRPSVAKAIGYFRKEGWLVCERTGFKIKDRAALAEQSREGLGRL